MRKKVISVILATSMLATMMSGCGGSTQQAGNATTDTKNENGATASDYKGTVRFLNYKPEVADAMQEVAAAYTNETGIACSIETAASGQYEATLTARLDSSDAPSLFICDSVAMYNRWKDYCADLSGTELYSYVTSDAYTLNDGNGTIYGISYALEAWGIIVNSAITDAYFASPNKSTEYTSLDDLYTFDALKAVVEDMQKMKDELGIEGVFGSTSLKTGDDWRYQTHLMNQPLFFEWGGNEGVNLNGPIPEFTFKYEKNFKDILDLYLDNSCTERTLVGTKTVDDSMAEFALGKCAMIQNGDWAWNTIANTEGKVVEDDKVKFIPITTGVEGEDKLGLNVGPSQYMCINSTLPEEEQKAAADFMTWLFTSETGKELVAQKLQFVTPFTTMADAVYTNPLFASENEIAAAGKTAYCWAATLIPDQTWKDNYGASLLMYAQGQKDWDAVVKDAVDEWAVEREITNTANGN